MRAVVLRAGSLVLADVPEPTLGPGQLLVEPIAVGICGSDLSAWQHTDDFLQSSRDTDMTAFLFDPERDLVMGHEFTSRVIEAGDGVTDYAPGDVIVTLPSVVDPAGVARCVGYSTDYPGGLAERVVVQAYGHLAIPPGVSPELAAITEPLATGVNAVQRSGIQAPAGAVVIGCGPIGLGTVLELAQRGIEPIVASDPSAIRRDAAASLGAHVTVDPAVAEPIDAWRSVGSSGTRLHVFEASGRPGMLNTLLYGSPSFTRITVAGACMVDDVIRPVVAVNKNVTIDFITGPGYGETSYAALATTFRYLVEQRFDPTQIVTGYAGLEGAPAVFEQLRPGDPHRIGHVKVLIRHDLDTATVSPLRERPPQPADDAVR